jgi:cytoskeletal protein RodZ
MAPVLISIVVAALAGLLVWGVFSGQIAHVGSLFGAGSSGSTTVASGTASTSTASTSASASSSSSSSAQESSTTAQPSESSTSATATQSVDKSTAVRVVNATGISGYAGTKAGVLQQAGYTSVTAANPSGSTLPDQTVVWYQDEADEATAKDVASSLGISEVLQQSGLSAPIVVVLLD